MSDLAKMKWYVIQSFSGFETKVLQSLKRHILLHSMKKKFGKILIPKEEVIEIKNGQKRKSERKFFPGYILINMIMDEKSWYLVKSIPKVIGFIGGTPDNPTSIDEEEVISVMNRLEQSGNKPKPKILFEPGEVIRVNSGPFADFNGVTEEVDYEKSRLKVSVSIFGRSTPVELDFNQVEKL
ncbi:hypothetical protein AOQ88_01490 [Candidatus Riesia sp. GBBU]|nr:hypothetical protein AOQ88_01490 [Candidatus Riesia sp. GBBU]